MRGKGKDGNADAHLVLKDHHQNPREPALPPALVLGIHVPDSLPDPLLVINDLVHRRPPVLLLWHVRMPVVDLVRLVGARVDPALKEVGKVCRGGERL